MCGCVCVLVYVWVLLKNYYYYYYYHFTKKRLNALYKVTKDVSDNLWRAQTALIHYTRGPAE